MEVHRYEKPSFLGLLLNNDAKWVVLNPDPSSPSWTARRGHSPPTSDCWRIRPSRTLCSSTVCGFQNVSFWWYQPFELRLLVMNWMMFQEIYLRKPSGLLAKNPKDPKTCMEQFLLTKMHINPWYIRVLDMLPAASVLFRECLQLGTAQKKPGSLSLRPVIDQTLQESAKPQPISQLLKRQRLRSCIGQYSWTRLCLAHFSQHKAWWRR